MATAKLNCPHGFSGTREQLIHALDHQTKRESLSAKHVREAARWVIEEDGVRISNLEAALKVIVGTSCPDPGDPQTDKVRLSRISDMSRIALDIPF
jgi:hypothetical protein